MKKMLFSDIAMVAFAGSASAQTKVIVVKLSDAEHCEKKANEYVAGKEGLTGDEAKLARKSYYDGCIGAKAISVTPRTK